MKLNKENCRASLCVNGTAGLEAMTRDKSFPKARVIEVPKVWREGGEQYKVTWVSISAGWYTALEGIDFIVKAPYGCNVICPWAKEIVYYD